MATASIILLNRNGPLEGSSIYTSLYVYIILKIPVISSTWWPHRRFAFCQRQHFLQCRMGSRHKPLSSAGTSALHIHPRASLILALRPHTHSPTHTQTENTPTYMHCTCIEMCTPTGLSVYTCTKLGSEKKVYLLYQAWRGTRVSDLHLKQANTS